MHEVSLSITDIQKINVYSLLGMNTKPLSISDKQTGEEILKIVLKYCDIKLVNFKGLSRQSTIVRCRQLVCWFLDKYTNLTLKEIAALIRPGYHHATVLHSKETCEKDFQTNYSFKVIRDSIEVKVQNLIGIQRILSTSDDQRVVINITMTDLISLQEAYEHLTIAKRKVNMSFTRSRSVSFLWNLEDAEKNIDQVLNILNKYNDIHPNKE